ncbi:transposase, partial [Bacteroides pyogenes]|uniref:transposase n=1 Tax=Bacteroides pyogenes TaxID=310300 RepID=UPI0021CCA520
FVFLAVHNNFCNFFSCHHKFYFWAQRYWSKRLQKIRGLPEAYIQLITKLKSNMKGALMSVSDKLLLRKRAIIETVNDELKNIAQIEHSRHRCFDNFIVNLLGAIAAYCLFPKKPCINVQRTLDTQLALF